MRVTPRPRTVVILGSTGSIGTQAAQVLAAHTDRFRVVGLAAGGGRTDLLARQVLAFSPRHVAVAMDGAALSLREAIGALARERGVAVPQADIAGGTAAVRDVAGVGAEIVLNGITGSIGLGPTLAALDSGATLALANKESLVAGGPLVRSRMRREGQIVPVDSEHSAIAQALRAGKAGEVDRLVLTASGGPFRGWTRQQLAEVGPAAALAHPTWQMGPVVSVNSATLMNKALELVEAAALFGVPPDRIDVVVHPQSIVHSMVTFRDGATVAQASPPDMRLPIALALAWPDRLGGVTKPLDFATAQAWTFEPVDDEVFPAVGLARAALAASPLHPAVMNAANEAAVEAFLAGRVGFANLMDGVTEVVNRFGGPAGWREKQTGRAPGPAASPARGPAAPPSEAEIAAAQRWARSEAATILGLDAALDSGGKSANSLPAKGSSE